MDQPDDNVRDAIIAKYIGDPAGRRKLLTSMQKPLQIRIDFRDSKRTHTRHPVDPLIDTFRRVESLMTDDEKSSDEYRATAALVTRWLGGPPPV